jgi:type VI secretion system protein ImpA
VVYLTNLEAWLSATKESPPCGPNLEHDLAFFGLEETARVKAEQRIGDAVKPREDPDWPKVVELADALLARTKDLRVSVHLTRALTRTEGVFGLATGLGLIQGLLEHYWDTVHPLLEVDQGNDPTERLNSLGPLVDPEGVIGDLRDVDLVSSREHGQLRAREVEIALKRLVPSRTTDSAAPKTLDQIHGQIAAAFASDRTVPSALRDAREHVLTIQKVVTDRVGADRAIDLKPLAQSLESLLEACDTALGLGSTAASGSADQASSSKRPVVAGEISTREDAVRVLTLVCNYLEQHEPSNPAPLFIRRAQRLMQKNFLEIVKDLLPDSLSNLEKLAGEAVEKKK